MSDARTISIITVNLNNREGLEKTLNSVVNQTCTDYELLIIDGGSTDGSVDVIRALSDKISYWISEPDQSIYHAMNKGLAKVNGEYCLFLNAGDWLTDNGLVEAIRECTGEEIIYFNCYLSYNNSRFEEQTYPKHLTLRSFYKRTIGHQSTLIRSSLFGQYGNYSETYRIHSDYEFWIKTIILENATCKYVNKFLCFYDMAGQSAMSTQKSAQEISSILDRYVPRRVQEDYAYWYAKEREMEILEWYKANKPLYAVLVFIYKVIKNVNRLFSPKPPDAIQAGAAKA
jgi:glycosyltransferase involved in cell wall biosynthesis